jgi:hypothetical protein
MSENVPALKDFPPNLRKVALVYAESDKPLSFKEACELACVPFCLT